MTRSIFISYSHADETWKDNIKRELSHLESTYQFTFWDDRKIRPGENWESRIDHAVQECSVALLLISSHFIESAFISQEEFIQILARHEADGMSIIPVIIDECNWREIPWLAAIQTLLRDGIPLNSSGNNQNAYKVLSLRLQDVLAYREQRLVSKSILYLQTVIARSQTLPLYYPPEAHFPNVRVKVRVSERGVLDGKIAATKRELIFQNRPSFSDDVYRYKMGVIGLKRGLLQKINSEIKGESLFWDTEVRDKIKRGVIVGDPGFGKSWLLRSEASYLAQKAIDLLDRPENLDKVVWPVLIRLPDFAQAIYHQESGSAFTVPSLVAQVLRDRESWIMRPDGQSEPIDAEVIRVIRQHVGTSQAILLLDALDEVPNTSQETITDSKNKPQTPRAALKNTLRTWVSANQEARVLVTSRHVNYDEPPWQFTLRTEVERELELLPFDDDQISDFITSWFKENESLALQVQQLITDSPHLRGMAELPLLIGFICTLCSEQHTNEHFLQESLSKMSRSEIYEKFVDRLLEREWDNEYNKESRNAKKEDRLFLLKDLAYHLMLRPGAQYSKKALSEVMSKLVGTINKDIIETLIKDLSEGIGFLIKNGALKASNPQYLFLHLTVQEYLAAAYISENINHSINEKGYWDQKNSYFYKLLDEIAWSPKWNHVILLASSIVSDPLPLVHLLAFPQKDDRYVHRLALAVHCLGENWFRVERIPEGYTSTRLKFEDIRDKIAARVYVIWSKHSRQRTDALISHVSDSIPLLCRIGAQVNDTSLLLLLINNLDEDDHGIRKASIDVIKKLPTYIAEQPEAVKRLVVIFLKTENTYIRESLTQLLGKASEKVFKLPFYAIMLAEVLTKMNFIEFITQYNELYLASMSSVIHHLDRCPELIEALENGLTDDLRPPVIEMLHYIKPFRLQVGIGALMQPEGEEEFNIVKDIQTLEGAIQVLSNQDIDSKLDEDAVLRYILMMLQFGNRYSGGGEDEYKNEITPGSEAAEIGVTHVLKMLGSEMPCLRDDAFAREFAKVIIPNFHLLIREFNTEGIFGRIIIKNPALIDRLLDLLSSEDVEIRWNAYGLTEELFEHYELIHTLEPDKATEIRATALKLLEAAIFLGIETEDPELKEFTLGLIVKVNSISELFKMFIKDAKQIYTSPEGEEVIDFVKEFFTAINLSFEDWFWEMYISAIKNIDVDAIKNEKEIFKYVVSNKNNVSQLVEIYWQTQHTFEKAVVIRILGQIGASILIREQLAALLKDGLQQEDEELCKASIEILGEFGDALFDYPEYITLLLEILKNEDRSTLVRETAYTLRRLANLGIAHTSTNLQLFEHMLSALHIAMAKTDNISDRISLATTINLLIDQGYRYMKQDSTGDYKLVPITQLSRL